jgi:CMP-N-acetylneuraminic acid synthetase
MMKRKSIVGEKPYFLELDKIESVDIDDEFDFEFAEFLYKKYTKRWILKS